VYKYRVVQKNVYTLAAVRRLRQCLDADGGPFEHLNWIQNSRTSLISILLLYKYSSYDYRVIFFMSKCVYFFWATLYYAVGYTIEESEFDTLFSTIAGMTKTWTWALNFLFRSWMCGNIHQIIPTPSRFVDEAQEQL